MGITLVQEQRLARVHGELQLALECAPLRRTRREIAEVIQPAFADRDHFRMRMQCAQLGVAFVGVFARVVRVHAGGREQESRMLACQLQGLRRALARSAGDDHLRDPGIARALQYRVEVVVETVVAEVGADVDELHG